MESPPYRINRGTDVTFYLKSPGGKTIGEMRGALPLTISVKLPSTGIYAIHIHDGSTSGGQAYNGFYRLVVAGSSLLNKTLTPDFSIE